MKKMQSIFFLILLFIVVIAKAETPIASMTPTISYLLTTTFPTEVKSQYEEIITLPSCEQSNPEVKVIANANDWDSINDPNKRIFCVKPGDYSDVGSSAGRIILKQSGSQNAKRYIILDNGNALHPGKLNRNQLAKVGFYFDKADFWVLDRMAYWQSTTVLNPILMDASSNNIINRYFMDNVGNGIYLYPDSNNNTIQNCRIQRDDISIFHDRAAIGLNSHSRLDENVSVSLKNTKIINNEVYNFVDGFQAIRSGWFEEGRVDENGNSILVITKNVNYEGTIVDNNHFYIDNK